MGDLDEKQVVAEREIILLLLAKNQILGDIRDHDRDETQNIHKQGISHVIQNN